MDRLYTAEARAYGARTGAVVSSDDRLDLQLSRPSEMGGDGGPGTNPEQLFAAGYAACFHSAMRFAVKDVGLSARALEGSHVTARADGAHPPDLPVLQGDRGERRGAAARRRRRQEFGPGPLRRGACEGYR